MTAASVSCWTCNTVVWRGGVSGPDGRVTGQPTGPVTDRDGGTVLLDGQTILTAYADVSCPRKGAGCPHTTAARDAADLDRAVTRAQLDTELGKLRADLDRAAARRPLLTQATWPVPTLTTGARDVTLTWDAPLGHAPVGALVVLDLPAGSEGRVTAAVKTLTPVGVTVTVTATGPVQAGGRVRVVVAGWPPT